MFVAIMGLKDRFQIKKIGYALATELIVTNHYLHRPAPCSFAFGLFDTLQKVSDGLFEKDKIVGVIIYGTPSSAPLRGGICGPEEKDNVMELTRLWICDSVGKNAESYLIGNTLKLVDKEIIVSYAEPEMGHMGIVYQATNWIYTGLSAKRTNWHIEGVDLHNQSLTDQYSSAELKEKFGDAFKLVDRPRKHRYVYFNCNKNRKKELLRKLRYKTEPYPKLT